MPLYQIEDTNTSQVTEVLLKWDELQEYLSSNPHFKLCPAAPAIVSGIAGRHKPEEGFRDVLREIKHRNRGSTIDP